jgi:hypothetical protein
VKSGDISADYFAVFAEEIKRLLKAQDHDPPFVGILSNGTSGDINNINFRPSPAEEKRQYQPYEKMRVVAREVAAEVFEVYQTVDHREWVPLAAAAKEIPLGVRVPGPDELRWAEQTLKAPPKFHVREEVYARRTLDMKDWPRQIPLLLQALRIGDAGIAAIPNEVFVEIGLEIRKRSTLKPTFTIELANGWYGYLPTTQQHKLGGYETWRGTNILEIEAAPKIVDGVLDLLQKVAGR